MSAMIVYDNVMSIMPDSCQINVLSRKSQGKLEYMAFFVVAALLVSFPAAAFDLGAPRAEYSEDWKLKSSTLGESRAVPANSWYEFQQVFAHEPPDRRMRDMHILYLWQASMPPFASKVKQGDMALYCPAAEVGAQGDLTFAVSFSETNDIFMPFFYYRIDLSGKKAKVEGLLGEDNEVIVIIPRSGSGDAGSAQAARMLLEMMRGQKVLFVDGIKDHTLFYLEGFNDRFTSFLKRCGFPMRRLEELAKRAPQPRPVARVATPKVTPGPIPTPSDAPKGWKLVSGPSDTQKRKLGRWYLERYVFEPEPPGGGDRRREVVHLTQASIQTDTLFSYRSILDIACTVGGGIEIRVLFPDHPRVEPEGSYMIDQRSPGQKISGSVRHAGEFVTPIPRGRQTLASAAALGMLSDMLYGKELSIFFSGNSGKFSLEGYSAEFEKFAGMCNFPLIRLEEAGDARQ